MSKNVVIAGLEVVDYNDPGSVISALTSVKADAVPSFIVDLTGSGPDIPARCKRFVPAEYANDIQHSPAGLSAEPDKPVFRRVIEGVCAREETEHTLVCCGVLMGFFLPRGKTGYFPDLGDDMPGLIPVPMGSRPRMVLVLENAGERINMTMARDVGKSVVRMLKVRMSGWEKYSYLSGDRVSWGEAAEVLGRITGEHIQMEHVGLEEPQTKAMEEGEKERGRERDQMKILAAELNEVFGIGSEVLPENTYKSEGDDFSVMIFKCSDTQTELLVTSGSFLLIYAFLPRNESIASLIFENLGARLG
ncbi:hypothetical protein F5Y15DRAFT_413046 [Xylariaceae sp. FL0016]|nr:hypothetical protein F5Y15DRAFT_413046 [Xylariaceae sp. FL0016]